MLLATLPHLHVCKMPKDHDGYDVLSNLNAMLDNIFSIFTVQQLALRCARVQPKKYTSVVKSSAAHDEIPLSSISPLP